MSLMWSQLSLNNRTAERKVRIISQNLGCGNRALGKCEMGNQSTMSDPYDKRWRGSNLLQLLLPFLAKTPTLSVLEEQDTQNTVPLCCVITASEQGGMLNTPLSVMAV